MQVYDFTTLYTNLNLEEVENFLSSLIDLIFSSKNKYICIGYDKSFISAKKYNGYYTFDRGTLKDAVKFIINNTFIKFGETSQGYSDGRELLLPYGRFNASL